MSRLVTFGCSYTEGFALPGWEAGSDDPWPSINNCTIKFSDYCWPKVLAKKLGTECVNIGRGGSSNLEILVRIQNFKFRPDDIVAVLWSFYTRENAFSVRFPGSIDRAHDPAFQFHEDYYKIHSDGDLFLRTKIYINYVKMLLEQNNLMYHMGSINQLGSFRMLDVHMTVPSPQLDSFPGIDKALDNAHPGVQSHEKYANIVYRRLTNEA